MLTKRYIETLKELCNQDLIVPNSEVLSLIKDWEAMQKVVEVAYTVIESVRWGCLEDNKAYPLGYSEIVDLLRELRKL